MTVVEGATPFPGLLHLTLDPYLIILSVKQGSIKYNFLSLWYDSTWYWTQVSRVIGEHSNHYANVVFFYSQNCILWIQYYLYTHLVSFLEYTNTHKKDKQHSIYNWIIIEFNILFNLPCLGGFVTIYAPL